MAKAKRKSTKRQSPSRASAPGLWKIDPTIPPPPPPTAAETLTTRQSTHGDFSENARVMQGLRRMLRSGGNWFGADHTHGDVQGLPVKLTDVQCEAIEIIVVKLGRIVTGDPNHADNWLDIEGYARLARERL